jgi:AraC-like DNA-binding protein
MMDLQAEARLSGAAGELHPRVCREISHIDVLRCFPELVQQLGGDSKQLLRQSGIDPAVLKTPGSLIGYRSRLRVMECAARQLSCPDFGLRLAMIQGSNPGYGPIGVVMRNSDTLGQAVGHLARYTYAYNHASRVRLEPDRAHQQLLLWLEFLIEGTPDPRQLVEHGFMLLVLQFAQLTGGAARVRGIQFRHEAHLPLKTYRGYFGCDVSFGENVDGLVLGEGDLACPIVNADHTVYEMATSFLADRFPEQEPPIRARVRSLILKYLGSADCTIERVAADLYLHQRTLQRRLRAEGESFEGIKDELRREVALRYIGENGVSLKRLAEMLGYAETSVVSRNFSRWFKATPRQLIQRQKAELAAQRVS